MMVGVADFNLIGVFLISKLRYMYKMGFRRRIDCRRHVEDA